jgi:hypothetical protein
VPKRIVRGFFRDLRAVPVELADRFRAIAVVHRYGGEAGFRIEHGLLDHIEILVAYYDKPSAVGIALDRGLRVGIFDLWLLVGP